METRTFVLPDTQPNSLGPSPYTTPDIKLGHGQTASFRRWSVYPEELVAMEIPREKLTFVEKIGTGRFGEVIADNFIAYKLRI